MDSLSVSISTQLNHVVDFFSCQFIFIIQYTDENKLKLSSIICRLHHQNKAQSNLFLLFLFIYFRSSTSAHSTNPDTHHLIKASKISFKYVIFMRSTLCCSLLKTFVILSIPVTPHIHPNILILATPIFCTCFFYYYVIL